MRHRQSGRRLNRNSSHRAAMFRNMASSLFEHETIRTTLPKAKELRRFAEPLITLAKDDSVANRRRAFSRLRSDRAVGKLFGDLGLRFASRPGGYLRILKDGFRIGDRAPMAVVQLTAQRGTVESTELPTPEPQQSEPQLPGDEQQRENQRGLVGRLKKRIFSSRTKEDTDKSD